MTIKLPAATIKRIRQLRSQGWTLIGIARQIETTPELVAIVCGEDLALLGNKASQGGKR